MTNAPSSVESLARAQALVDMGRYRAALDELSAALQSDPTNPRAWCLKANAHLGVGEPSKASDAARSALRTRPDDEWALRLLALASSRIPGAHDAALSAARRAVAVAPRSAAAHDVMARVLLEVGDFGHARAASKAAIELAPNSASFYGTMGLIELRSRHFRAARRAFLAELRQNPNSWTAHNNLGVISSRRGNRVGAARHFLRSLRIAPEQAPIKNLEGALVSSLSLLLNVCVVLASATGLAARASARLPAQIGVDVAVLLAVLLAERRLRQTVHDDAARLIVRSFGYVGVVASLLSRDAQSSSSPNPRHAFARVVGAATLVAALSSGFLSLDLGQAIGTLALFLGADMLLGTVIGIIKARFKRS